MLARTVPGTKIPIPTGPLSTERHEKKTFNGGYTTDLSLWLRRIRQCRGLKEDMLSKMMGRRKTWWALHEVGRGSRPNPFVPAPEDIPKLAEIFRMDPQDLLVACGRAEGPTILEVNAEEVDYKARYEELVSAIQTIFKYVKETA